MLLFKVGLTQVFLTRLIKGCISFRWETVQVLLSLSKGYITLNGARPLWLNGSFLGFFSSWAPNKWFSSHFSLSFCFRPFNSLSLYQLPYHIFWILDYHNIMLMFECQAWTIWSLKAIKVSSVEVNLHWKLKSTTVWALQSAVSPSHSKENFLWRFGRPEKYDKSSLNNLKAFTGKYLSSFSSSLTSKKPFWVTKWNVRE